MKFAKKRNSHLRIFALVLAATISWSKGVDLVFGGIREIAEDVLLRVAEPRKRREKGQKSAGPGPHGFKYSSLSSLQKKGCLEVSSAWNVSLERVTSSRAKKPSQVDQRETKVAQCAKLARPCLGVDGNCGFMDATTEFIFPIQSPKQKNDPACRIFQIQDYPHVFK